MNKIRLLRGSIRYDGARTRDDDDDVESTVPSPGGIRGDYDNRCEQLLLINNRASVDFLTEQKAR